jgi:hypothetical protein
VCQNVAGSPSIAFSAEPIFHFVLLAVGIGIRQPPGSTNAPTHPASPVPPRPRKRARPEPKGIPNRNAAAHRLFEHHLLHFGSTLELAVRTALAESSSNRTGGRVLTGDSIGSTLVTERSCPNLGRAKEKMPIEIAANKILTRFRRSVERFAADSLAAMLLRMTRISAKEPNYLRLAAALTGL